MSSESTLLETTLHGVFMSVFDLGVLITGDSGLGKSEVALGLVSRGQCLVADDAPRFTRVDDQTIQGHCPAVLQDFLEVRGLGILNIRALFGQASIVPVKPLAFIVHLMQSTDIDFAGTDRLHGIRRLKPILGVDIPEVTIPVAPGRSLAVLVEIAVRNEMLKRQGYNASDDFIQRQHCQY